MKTGRSCRFTSWFLHLIRPLILDLVFLAVGHRDGWSFRPGHRLTVIIWGRNRHNFPSTPERFYSGEDICVTGLIELYESVVEIEARDSSDVEI
ncbi:MAG: hypothetical protein ACOC6F_03800 [bacterium]